MDFAVRTQGLTKQFDNMMAVKDVNLQIKPGEVYGLIGPNGAGKTTLLRMLATADNPTSGYIYINEDRLRRDSDNLKIKRHLAYLPDDFPVYEDLTVWAYINYFARLYNLREPERSRRIVDVLNLVSLNDKRDEKIAKLSRGMKQRVSLARTVVHNPSVLLLDEPVSGLDPKRRDEFMKMVKRLQETGTTIIISSHILNDLEKICTSIGIMNQGQLIVNDSLENLYTRRSQQHATFSTLTVKDANHLEKEIYLYLANDRFLITRVESIPEKKKVKVYFNYSKEQEVLQKSMAGLLTSVVEAGISVIEYRYEYGDLDDIFLALINR